MFITHADAELFGVSFGSGPRAVLALGGWIGSWELWVEPFTLLSHTWRTIAYDHRGVGAAIAPIESITFSNMVDDVFAVMDAFGIHQCILAGESAGAAVAIQAVLQRPERFSGLIVVSGLYQRERPTHPDLFVRALQTNYRATLEQFVDTCVPEPNSEAIRHWGRQIVSRASQRAAVQLYESLYGIDLRPYVQQIAHPTLIVHGDVDALVPISAAEWLARQIRTSCLVRLPGAGHVPTITRPQEVAAAIDRFFV